MWFFVTFLMPACVPSDEDTGDPVHTGETGDSGEDTGETGDSGKTGDTGDTAPSGPVLLDVVLHDVEVEDRDVAWDAQDTRGDNLRRDGPYRGHDVLVFTDLRDSYVATGLFAELALEYPHRTNVVGETTAGWAETLNFDFDRTRSGGVVVLSRWDIDEPVQYVFTTPGCGAEAVTAAGFLYARLDVDGRTAHLLATRLQPDDPGCADAAATRAAQLGEIRDWLAANPKPADETFLVAGSLGIDRGSPELAGALDALGVAEPLYVGHDALFDPTLNELATAYSPYTPQPGRSEDYVFDRHGTAPQWHNLGLDLRGTRWWANGGVWSDELSPTFPVLAFAWATSSTPTASTRPRRYDAVSFQSPTTGAWLAAAADEADNTLQVSDPTADPRAWFDLAGADADDPDQDCLATGPVRAERSSRRTHYWTVDGRFVLMTLFGEADPALGVEVLSGDCLEDGSQVAIYREDDSEGRRYGHIQTGGGGVVLYFSAFAPGELETFTAHLSTAAPEDWSGELVYRPE